MDFGCDMVRCISLKHRTDKQIDTTKILNGLGIDFQYFSAIEDKENPSRGCFNSHIQILKEAYDSCVQRVMIFEDDIGVKNTNIEDIKKVNRFLDKNKDLEIFYLGSFPSIFHLNKLKPVEKHIYKGQFIEMHAYIVNRSGIERFKDTKWKEPRTNIDIDVYSKHDKAYAIFPCIYIQRIVSDLYRKPKPILIIRSITVEFFNMVCT